MPSNLSVAEARNAVRSPDGMEASTCRAVLELLLAGTLGVDDGAELLRAWAQRGESGIEVATAVRLLRERARASGVTIPCLDVCGTGGSGRTRYNISTTVAFIAAAARIPVAKHGNRGSRRPNGSFDLLDALGVAFDFEAPVFEQLLEETGVCFFFARSMHPAVGAAAPYRKAAGCRTIFNFAGPLANPAPLAAQVIGVCDEDTAAVVASAVAELSDSASTPTTTRVVWGEPGIDELGVSGANHCIAIAEGQQQRRDWSEAPCPGIAHDALPGGDAETNAELFAMLLQNRCQSDAEQALLEMLCLNAGAAIDLWNGSAPSLRGEGYALAQQLIADGSAWSAFERHREMTARLS